MNPEQLYSNMKDDNVRLNDHTQIVLEELALFTQKMTKLGIDARAIFCAVSTFKDYYENFGRRRLGDQYMIALEAQASKLSDAMIARDTHR